MRPPTLRPHKGWRLLRFDFLLNINCLRGQPVLQPQQTKKHLRYAAILPIGVRTVRAMAASTKAVSLWKDLLPFLCTILACTVIASVSPAAAQSRLDDVHITAHEATVAVASADYSPDLALAARAPRIRTNVDLVLVPGSV